MGDQIHKIHYFLIPSEWSMYFFYENTALEVSFMKYFVVFNSLRHHSLIIERQLEIKRLTIETCCVGRLLNTSAE